MITTTIGFIKSTLCYWNQYKIRSQLATDNINELSANDITKTKDWMWVILIQKNSQR